MGSPQAIRNPAESSIEEELEVELFERRSSGMAFYLDQRESAPVTRALLDTLQDVWQLPGGRDAAGRRATGSRFGRRSGRSRGTD